MAKTKEEYNLSPEIEKLAERLAKDPSSKLFVPLAEEYLKGGMFEEAITVLKDGLKHHPSYISARVALGKAYHKKGLIKESLEEFKKVVAVNPDNLLAHKRLVEIHKVLGNIEDAIKSCNTILLLNPKDEEIKGILKQLEGIRPVSKPFVAPEKKEEKVSVAAAEKIEAVLEEKPEELVAETAIKEQAESELIEAKKPEPEIAEEIKEKEKPLVMEEAAAETIPEEPKEMFKIPEDAGEEIRFEEEKKDEKAEESLWTMPEEEKPAVLEEEGKAPAADEKVYELKEEKDEEFEGLIKLKPVEQPKNAKEKEAEAGMPVYEISEEELISFPKDLLQSDEEIIQEAKMKEGEVTSLDISSFEKKPGEAYAPKVAMPEEDMIIIEEPESEILSIEPPVFEKEEAKEEISFKEPVYEEKVVKAKKKAEEELSTETLAELYIKQGFYEKGIDIYRKLLEEKPGSKELKQKLDDAVTLSSLFVSGKPKTEEIIPGVLVKKGEADFEGIEIEEIAPPEPASLKIKADISAKPSVERPKEPEKKIGSPKMAPQLAKGGKQKAKVQRLQSWLENIKKEQPQL
ncbi:MAG: tetratricopeptide repeat protein [Nitrospirae bacterium]|nr:tetratricopeptide repeat protein [Nitrospirota bacterium]